MQMSDKFNLYRQFRTHHEQAVYLSVDVNKCIRNSLIKPFRFGVSPVVVHFFAIQNTCLHRCHMSFV